MGQVIRLQESPRTTDLPACVTAFLNFSRSKNLAAETLAYYAGRLRAFARFTDLHCPDATPGDITPGIVREFITWVRESSSPATANHSLAVLKRFFGFLYDEGFVTSNPAERVQKQKEQKRVIDTFTSEQLEAVLSACGRDFYGTRDRAVILTLLDCGLRASELCGLTLDAVDWSEQTFRVIGKGDRERIVPFGHGVRQSLGVYLAKRGEKLQTPYLFVTHFGERLDRYRLRDVIQRRCREAGVTGVRCSPHTLRHTCAVSYLRSGGDTFTLQNLLGHCSQVMTRRYCESLTADDVQAKHREYSPVDNMKGIGAKDGRRRLR